MARLIAELNDELYKRFKIICMREEKTIKDKITEIIEDSCFDKLYEIKYINIKDIFDILYEYDSVQINIIDGHMIGYSQERTPLVDEEILTIIYKEDFDECKELGLDFDKWLCDSLDDSDFARENFIRFLPDNRDYFD